MRILLLSTALAIALPCSSFGEGSEPANEHRVASNALAGLTVANGLNATLVASEPMLFSPSNIDVDHRGRIWVCEVVNYRHFANKDNPVREAGDRILVLEDTTGDGLMDKRTTFYQGRDIDSAHGVCVLGNRVIVSAGPNVFDFHDDDGDLKADRKELLFTGIKGEQHDHGIHSFTFGSDGRLYFNFGNEGKELHHADGSIVVDVAGNEVRDTRRPYQQGMAFRCELDGSRVDTVGWNFRNNWELCVDSFGTVWQSDNDDDGNRGVRINYVMEYGNYGYRDEVTGAGWRQARTGMAHDIPQRHWHLNDPGVVPNLLQTGAGSPTGILCYEGDLLPQRFHNQLIHCDAGPNVVRSYTITNNGAGYSATVNGVLAASTDQWFRPSDVCVAPDGSLIVADWYDPGVGGHRQGDIGRGRLFRVAPPGSRYTVPQVDLNSVAGAAVALRSPNIATRYLAWQYLRDAGTAAVPTLTEMFETDRNPRVSARALWLLGQITPASEDAINRAISDPRPNIRITALRLARRQRSDVAAVAAALAQDKSPQVRREVAVALRHLEDADKRVGIWATLATQMPTDDRWYLEALGIGAEGIWDQCMAAAFMAIAHHNTPESTSAGDFDRLWWRSRGRRSARGITARIVAEATSKTPNLQRLLSFFRALDFQAPEAVAKEASALLQQDRLDQVTDEVTPVLIAESLQRLGNSDFSANPNATAALERALNELNGTSQFVQLVERFQLTNRYPELLALAQAHPDEQLGVDAIVALIRLKSWRVISMGLRSKDTNAAVATARALGNSLDESVAGFIVRFTGNSDLPIEVRRALVRTASKIRGVATGVANIHREQGLSPELEPTLAAALHGSSSRGTRELASRLFPLPPAKEGKPLPPVRKLVQMRGDVKNGRLVFNTTGTCHKCHVVNRIGREIGPDLSEIGSKLSRQALFESIIFPSAGISHNYEAYTLVLTSGTTANGLIVSETEDEISLKGDDGLVRKFATADLDEIVKQKISLMPADLQKVMSVQEMVDVVEYALSLKKAVK